MSAVDHFRTQAEGCGRLGSAMYADLIARLADDLQAGGPTDVLVAPYADASGPAAIALRLTGGLHRLVLDGAVPELAAYYPSVGGEYDGDAAWPHVEAALRDHADAIAETMTSPPQTNEVGRSAALMAGLLALSQYGDLPVRLFEIGAGAGLNLLVDRYRFVDDEGREYGAADSDVVITNAWPARELSARTVTITERLGCDISPISLESDADENRLLSYVWPDMSERFDRARAAVHIARTNPPTVRQQRALDFVSDLTLQDGTLTVLWHSVMWQYVDPPERDGILEQIASLSMGASDQAPLLHLRLEPRRRKPGGEHEFLLAADHCRGGSQSTIVAHTAPHGPPVEWE
ncbi:DUF2332 family protein [Epidermidibacterium keratini]|uniref:DUF2332 family protein n=1 Tax=Epidermidibacterium keratini TaxID=1891644 RepID=A0A7L4YME4_9ACTN|nr:DUF2332 domain-containing protein [Epidermidibacterium keratini]QHB99716.1 DUF2332 family protein [Epidermidibacterium keratini]